MQKEKSKKQKIKVVCFDFDDVLTEKDMLTRSADMFGHMFAKLRLAAEILEDNREPRKFFRTLKKIVMLGKGFRYDRIEGVTKYLKPNKNAAGVLKKLKKSGHKIVVVSVNDVNIIKKFLKSNRLEKYIDHIYAARLGVDNGILNGKIYGDVIKTEKVGVVKKIKNLYNVKESQIVYIGDGLTDIPIMKRVGKGILFHPNPITHAEVLMDKNLKKMEKDGRFFLVKDKDLNKIMEFVE